MGFDIFITIFFVLLNGFFVAAEFSIVKVRLSQLEMKVREGSAMAATAKGIVNKLDAYLSACQLGITLASLGLGWIGESVVSKIIVKIIFYFTGEMDEELAHNIAFPVAFLTITVLHIVFGEMAPKSIGIQRPEATSMWLSYPLKVFYIVFWPFIWVLNRMSNAVIKMVGITPSAEHGVHNPQELLYILEESKESGMIRSQEHKLLENVFDFYDRPAKEIMVPRTLMVSAEINDDLETVVQKIISEGYSRIPVFEENIDNIKGILFSRDLIHFLNIHKGADKWTSFIRPAYLIPETKKLGNLLRDMQTEHVQMAIVLDEYGGTSGLLTIEDIVEELVGEIQDEFDNEQPWVLKTGENEFLIQGRCNILDANEQLPVQIPDGADYDTIAGYIIFLMGKIPSKNDKVSTKDYSFEVVEMNHHNIISVKARQLQQSE